jgi:hypothetical protein
MVRYGVPDLFFVWLLRWMVGLCGVMGDGDGAFPPKINQGEKEEGET